MHGERTCTSASRTPASCRPSPEAPQWCALAVKPTQTAAHVYETSRVCRLSPRWEGCSTSSAGRYRATSRRSNRQTRSA